MSLNQDPIRPPSVVARPPVVKYRVRCIDCRFLGQVKDARYKADQEMWQHRWKGHQKATVEEVKVPV